MKRLITLLFVFTLLIQPCFAWSFNGKNKEEKAVEKVLKSQVRYANKTDFEHFIKTYDSQYVNADGFNLDVYSSLVKDIWKTFDNIKYGIDIKKIEIDGNRATVELVETSFAEIEMTKAYEGELKSYANSIYNLEKKADGWKVVSDKVLDETTSMLYGNAKDLDIKLTVPDSIESNKDYTATLEFTPPKETIAIASLAADIVEYPQKKTEEVFRTLPEDNILERIFTSNSKNVNEYIVASIGLTKTSVCDLDIKLSLTGFGYTIKRVNVIHGKDGATDVKSE